MKTDHTPGPWKVARSCHVKEAPDGLFFHVAHITVDDDYAPNPIICEVGNRGRFCSEQGAIKAGPEQAANARLIAAAPDMLDALQYLSNLHPRHCILAEVIRARTAIAKLQSGGTAPMSRSLTAICCARSETRLRKTK